MNNRWIDQYTLRYALGTIVGSIIVAQLIAHLPPEVKSTISSFDTWGQLLTYVTVGFAFCYVASAPLLLAHIGRVFLYSSTYRSGKPTPFVIGGIACVVMTGITYLSTCDLSRTIANGALAAIAGFQGSLAVFLFYKQEELYDFYTKLSAARINNAEFVESYRGIREHGNACSIVLLEVALGILIAEMLSSIDDTSTYPYFTTLLIFSALWLAPSFFALVFASKLEIRMIQKHE